MTSTKSPEPLPDEPLPDDREELDELDAVLCSMIFKDYMEEVAKRLGE